MFMKPNFMNNVLIENIGYKYPHNYLPLENMYLRPKVAELLTNAQLDAAEIHSILAQFHPER